MVASGESQLRMFVVHVRFGDGFFLVLAPAVLSPEQVSSLILDEVGVDAEAVLELGGWKTTSDDVAVARVPFPGGNSGVVGADPMKKAARDGRLVCFGFLRGGYAMPSVAFAKRRRQADGAHAEEDESAGFGDRCGRGDDPVAIAVETSSVGIFEPFADRCGISGVLP